MEEQLTFDYEFTHVRQIRSELNFRDKCRKIVEKTKVEDVIPTPCPFDDMGYDPLETIIVHTLYENGYTVYHGDGTGIIAGIIRNAYANGLKDANRT